MEMCKRFSRLVRLACLVWGLTGVLSADDHIYSSAVDQGLTFYCPYDGTADAAKSLGDPKAIVAGPKALRFAAGIRNQGLRIGRSASGQFHATYSGLRNIDYRQGTIAFWIKPENWTPTAQFFNLFVTARKPSGVFFVYKYQGDNLLFYSAEDQKTSIARSSVADWKAGQWHHVVATWDRQAQRLYLDGQLKQTVARQKNVDDRPFSSLEIGFRDWEKESGTSVIDELKIFNRVLTPAEIDGDYHSLAIASSLEQGRVQLAVGRGTPKVDGRITSGEYPFAGTGFFNPGAKFAFRQSRYHLAHDDRFLYVAVETPQPVPPVAGHLERDGQVWRDDSVEVWLSPEPSVRYQLIYNSKGTVFDARHGKVAEQSWNLEGYALANRMEGKVWTSELAIPLTAIGGTGRGTIKFNLGRTIIGEKPEEFICVAPVRKHFGYSDLLHFVDLCLEKEVPRFSLERLGDLNKGKVDMEIRTVTGAQCRVSYATQSRTWYDETLSSVDGLIRFQRANALGGILKMTVSYGDKILYCNNLQTKNPSPVAVQYIYTDIGPQLLQVVLKNEGGQDGGQMVLSLKPRGSGTVRTHRIQVRGDQVFWTEAWSIGDLPPGDYDFEAVYTDAEGHQGKAFQQWYRKSPARCPWENNRIGIYPGEVPKPWIPMTCQRGTVTTLMQRYSFEHSILPVRFRANGHDILSRPCQLLLNGRPVPGQAVKTVAVQPDVCQLETSGTSGTCDITSLVRMEYDGMMWFTMKVTGTGQRIESLVLDIPLKPVFAEQVHSNDGDTHHAQFGATGLVPKDGWHKNLYRKPAFWVGNDQAGIAWYAETLKGWRNRDKNRSVEIVPGQDEMIVRLNIIDVPLTLNGTRTLAFGLHGTPVKHPSADVRPNRLNREWGWSDATLYFNYLDGGKEFFDRWYLNLHKRRYEKLKANRFFLYVASNGASPYCPEWGYWGKVWTSRAIGDYIIEKNLTNLAQRNKWVWTYSCLNSRSFREFYLWQLNQVLHNPEWDVKNLYYDLVGPRMCNNTEHGCGWRDDEGVLWPTQNLLGAREFHKRAYHLMQKLHPDAMHLYHVTGQPVVPAVHAFCDAIVEGETFFGQELVDKETYFGVISPKMFRVAYNGQKWGYPTIFIPQLQRAASFSRPDRLKYWKMEVPPPAMLRAIRHFLGYALVHDISIWTGERAFQLQQDKVWNPQKAFLGGWDKRVQFIPYWRKERPFDVKSEAPERLMVSAYTRDRRAVLIVMNDTDLDQRVQLQVNVKKLLGHSEALVMKTLEGQERKLPQACWDDTIPARIFKVYFLK